MLMLIWFTFMFSNLKTFEVDDDKVKTKKMQKVIEHIERIRSLFRRLEEDDTSESGEDNSESGEISEESGTDAESEASEQSSETNPDTTSSPQQSSGNATEPESGSSPSESSSSSSGSSDPLAEPTIPKDIKYPEKPPSTPIFVKYTKNRYAFIHILRYRFFRIEEKDSKYVIKFVLLLRFINMAPLEQTQFSIKINFKTSRRELQESPQSEDATVLCLKHSQFSFDSYAIDAYYICSSEATHEISNVESYNDYNFKDSQGNPVSYSSSLQSIKAAKNLNEETQPLREFVYFENAAFSKGPNSLFIRGNLKGDKRDEVAKKDKLILTFYEEKEEIVDVQNYTINALNSTCDVKNNNPDNFEIECFPESFNINGSQQFLINGTTIVSDTSSGSNIEIYLNTTESSDSFSYYKKPEEKQDNRGANANILGYNGYKTKNNPKPINPLRPVVIEFTLFVKFTSITPFGKITFSMKCTYYTVAYVLRRLQVKQTEENTTAVCEMESLDEESQTASYTCSAETTQVPDQAESLNNFEFFDDSGEPVLIETQDINFSKDALEGGKNLTIQTSTYKDIVSINEAAFMANENENDTSSFLVKGYLSGSQKSTVAKQDSLIMTFYDVINEERFGYNTTCEVINHDVDDFSIKCSPEHNVSARNQYLTNGTTLDNKVGIYLNTTNKTDNFSLLKYGKTTKNSNVVWRKTSSGLSGGAIAGIVIACAVTLILITILLMFLRKSKKTQENNSTIVGLKSVDYYNE